MRLDQKSTERSAGPHWPRPADHGELGFFLSVMRGHWCFTQGNKTARFYFRNRSLPTVWKLGCAAMRVEEWKQGGPRRLHLREASLRSSHGSMTSVPALI